MELTDHQPSPEGAKAQLSSGWDMSASWAGGGCGVLYQGHCELITGFQVYMHHLI